MYPSVFTNLYPERLLTFEARYDPSTSWKSIPSNTLPPRVVSVDGITSVVRSVRAKALPLIVRTPSGRSTTVSEEQLLNAWISIVWSPLPNVTELRLLLPLNKAYGIVVTLSPNVTEQPVPTELNSAELPRTVALVL